MSNELKYRALLVEFVDLLSKRDIPSELALLGLAERIEAALADPVQAEPIKEGYRLVAVNEAFSELMYYLERASGKGYLDRLGDLVEPWEAFDYEYVDNPPAAQVAELVEALERITRVASVLDYAYTIAEAVLAKYKEQL